MQAVREVKANECLNLLRLGSRKLNQIRHYDGESKAHQAKKEELARQLMQAGHYIVTEAIFEDGNRADILVLDEFRVIEVVHSESEASITAKEKKYPQGLKIEVVKTWQPTKL